MQCRGKFHICPINTLYWAKIDFTPTNMLLHNFRQNSKHKIKPQKVLTTSPKYRIIKYSGNKKRTTIHKIKGKKEGCKTWKHGKENTLV